MKRLFAPLQNSRGNTLVVATIMMGTTALLAMGTMKGQQVLRERIHMVRVKTKMVAVENRLRAILSQTAGYEGCSYGTGRITCIPNLNFIAKYQTMMLKGPPCEQNVPGGCRIETRGLNFDPDSQTVTFEIHPVGLGGRFRHIDVSMKVPMDVLQLTSLNCATAPGSPGPIFRGFDPSTGAAICAPLPVSSCTGTRYISGINANTGAVICTDFPSETKSCGGSGYAISHLQWMAGGTVDFGCTELRNPFDVFPITDEGNTTGYTNPSVPGYTPPSLPANPSGTWAHSSWGFSGSDFCPGLSLYGGYCATRGYRCNQFHNGVGPETLVCQ